MARSRPEDFRWVRTAGGMELHVPVEEVERFRNEQDPFRLRFRKPRIEDLREDE